jgi:hypothetical protein
MMDKLGYWGFDPRRLGGRFFEMSPALESERSYRNIKLFQYHGIMFSLEFGSI